MATLTGKPRYSPSEISGSRVSAKDRRRGQVIVSRENSSTWVDNLVEDAVIGRQREGLERGNRRIDRDRPFLGIDALGDLEGGSDQETIIGIISGNAGIEPCCRSQHDRPGTEDDGDDQNDAGVEGATRSDHWHTIW